MVHIIVAHSILRWLIVLIAVLIVIKLAVRAIGHAGDSRFDRTLSASFAGIMDIQFLLGAAILARRAIVYGIQDISTVLPHTVNMLMAISAAHVASRWSKTPNKPLRTLLATAIALLFVILGVNELPQGWSS